MKKDQIIKIILLNIFILLAPLTIFAVDLNTLKKAAEQGNAQAQFDLGRCYEIGDGVPQNNKEAVKWYLRAAEQGYTEAQCDLGLCYEFGVGVPQSYEEAIKWYRKAAEQGNAWAQNALGLCYDSGEGVPQNYKEAVKWYNKAAEQGYTEAQYYLGWCYKIGKGVPQNYEEAVKWFLKAAKQGDAEAQFSIGLCYKTGKGVSQSYEEAVKWYRKAAEQGSLAAQWNLGICYANGEGVPQSYKEAVKWYRKAADRGEAEAQFYLGRCYENGEGVRQSYEEAVKWYWKAAEQGDIAAQCNLGRCYEKGNGVTQNWGEAVNWYQKAAEQGNTAAQCKLGGCYEYGIGIEQSWEEAISWYLKAAEQGDVTAQFNLGRCYDLGEGVPQNYEEAVKWYRMAAEQGYGLAQSKLESIQNLTLNQIQNQILTWEQYYNNNRKVIPKFNNEEEIKKTIEADVERWQEKGEFESTSAWKERVNDKTRNEFIRTATNNYVAQYNSDNAKLKSEQEKLYKEYEAYYDDALNSFYEFKIYFSLTNFNSSDFVLKPYDADHETFLIHSNNLGDILLPVPVSEAPSFKQNWSVIKKTITPEFVPNGDDVALSKLVFKNNGKEYVYDSHTQANYAIADVKYNFAPIELADIDLNNLNIDAGTSMPEYRSSKIISNTSDVIKPQNAQIDRVKISASEKSDVDFTIPQNGVNENTNTFAIIIANEKYHSVSHVPYAEKDGDILEKYLTRAIGLPKDHVAVYKNASFGNMAAALKHIENLSEAFGNDLNLIFYYAGHGMPNEKTKNPMLVPVDGDASIPETCYELDRIISTLGGLNANSVVVMLDACFSGTERGEGMLMAARGIRIKSNQSKPTGNMVILTASQGDETAYPYETEQHGLFTYFLLKKLQENKGDVTLGELADYITEQVKRQSVVSNGKLQTPTVSVSPSFQNEWRNFKLK